MNQTYKILIDGQWSLEDLMNFSRIYFQNYSFLYCLDVKADSIFSSRMENVLKEYELRHGLNYVSIYDVFRSHIEKEDRPQIKSIRYASPGWLELALDLDIALKIAKIISIYLATPLAIATTYKKLHKIYIDLDQQRKKHKINSLKLQKQQLIESKKLTDQLAKSMGFENLEMLDKHTKDTEETAKLIMAHHRRLNKLVKFVESGKAEFPTRLDDEN